MIQTYKNIPRQLVEFKDGGLVLRNDSEVGSTRSMLILGTAKDGPKDPVAIDIDTVEAVFGKDVNSNGVPNGATIVKAVHEAYRAGSRDIRAMRISGEAALAGLSNPAKTVESLVKSEEILGFAEGNSETTITLANAGVIKDSIKVFVKGQMLSTTLTYTEGTKELVIPADVTDAGAYLTIKYDYLLTETAKAIVENLTLDSGKKVYLAQKTPSSIVVKNSLGKTLTLASDYTVAGNVLTFTSLSGGDTVQVSYTADVVTQLFATENGSGSVPFRAEGGNQVFTLESVPVSGTVHVYANDSEVLGNDVFTVNNTTKEISINKMKLSKGETIAVTYFSNVSSEVTESIGFESVYAGAVYNQGSLEVQAITNKDGAVIGKKVIITKPLEKRASNEAPLVYTSIDYPTFGQLVDAINKDIRNGVFKARTNYPGASSVNLEVKVTSFYGGEDGLNLSKEELFEKLSGKRNSEGFLVKEGAYQLLENYNVDYVVLTGVYADDVLSGRYDYFDYELALFCAAVSHQSKTTYGYIEMSPCVDTTLQGISEYAGKLAAYNANKTRFLMKKDGAIYTDGTGQPIDLGKFVRIVAGPDMLFMSDSLGVHQAFNAVALCAAQSASASQSSLANKRIPGSNGLRYRFSKPQLDKITAAGIITFMQKFDNRGNALNGAYCVDSMTAARPGSDYVRTTTCEVVRDCVDDIREVSDPFLGEPITVEQKNALASAISKRLGIRKEQGVILDYSFQIVSTPQDQVLGKARIELTIVPPQELRELTTVVGLSPTL